MVPGSNESPSSVLSAPQSDVQPVVECVGVTRTFTRGGSSGWFTRGDAAAETVTAVADVSVAITPGELVGLAGPSGSGKSTLLHLLAGLDTPTSGTVTLAGVETSSVSSRRRTRLRLANVGIVFQHFHLLPSLSARGNVAAPLIETGRSKRERRRRAEALLEQVGLGDRVQHKPGELSGGEQQRVAVARALATDPALVIADEPTGELDTETGAQVLNLLAEVATDRAVVVASHDQQALDRTTRLLRLRDGRVTTVEG
ncbi:ABC transporter ATP-binding protein [Halobellus salinus]|uniref:ABC transporter ATP-binding protein n=1 Tax=Halobellus salinus TaxID=931585 RepID=UPI001662CAB9|nr:ABC transporter ATP-binding protein [Halobellus salinus]SMP12827.1 putative ABC transport system ATP-binding protein [Halobellus salinus]